VFIRFFVLTNPEESIKPIYGSLVERIIFLPAHIFSFIKLAFLPVHLTADYVFSYPPQFFAASNLIGFLFVTGLAVASVFAFKYSRAIFFAIWWFFITLFPVYNIIPIYNPLAERFLYIPLIGFCMLVAMAFNTLMNQRFSAPVPGKVLASVAVITLLSFYATVTISRNRDWKDSLTLWSKTVMTSPNSSTAHGSLGRAYQDLERWAEAIGEYKKAIALFPNNYKAYYNLGVLYDQQGALKEAVANYKSAIAIHPAFINAHFNLGNIYHNQGLLEEAIHHYRNVLELDPADSEARNNLGVAYAKQGKLDLAIAQWQKVLEMNPQNKSAADNIRKAKEVVD
jgi:tetratricopeptide (TPR) repeat protein